jgi:hypothetical protein
MTIIQYNEGNMSQTRMNIILAVKTEMLICKVRNVTRMSTLLFSIVLQFLAREVKQNKEVKRVQIRKDEVNLPLFVHDMILYLRDTEVSTPIFI